MKEEYVTKHFLNQLKRCNLVPYLSSHCSVRNTKLSLVLKKNYSNANLIRKSYEKKLSILLDWPFEDHI